MEGLQTRAHKVTMVLDLAPDDKVQWQRFDGKLRNQIRKAEKSGFRWVSGHSELLDDFYSVFARNMRDLGTPVYGKSFFAMCLKLSPRILESLRSIVSRNQLPLALVRGSEILLKSPGLPRLAITRTLPNNMLYWEAIQVCYRRGPPETRFWSFNTT